MFEIRRRGFFQNKSRFLLNINMLLIRLVQTHYGKLIQNLIKRVERKKREESRENDLKSKINVDTFDNYGGFGIRA